jgi:hypothetical protein
VLDTLTAFNLTALATGGPLNLKYNTGSSSFVASKQVAFATHFQAQILSCPKRNVTQQIRFIVSCDSYDFSPPFPNLHLPHGEVEPQCPLSSVLS